jgi:Fur family ferric uptake transcriptional regulator
LVCIQCNKTIEFNNDSILKHSLKQCEKEGFQLIDCQLTVMAICPEALRMGWPSGIPSNWGCTRSLVDTRLQNCEIPESKEPEPEN